MATVGDIVVNLTANTQQFSAGLNRGKSMISGFVSGIGGKMLGVAGAFLSVRSAVSLVTQETTEALVAERKLNSVLQSTGFIAGKTADEIQRFADARQSITNFEDDVTINAAALLATFTNIRGEAFEKTLVAAQDLATVMDGDLNNAVIQVAKAMNAPATGLVALRRVGIQFSDQQTDMIKKLVQSGDLMGAQSIILDQLKVKFGGAAEALSSPWQQLKNSFGNLAETIGRKLKPASDSLWSSMKAGIEDVNSALSGDGGANSGGGFLTELEALITGDSVAIIAGRKEKAGAIAQFQKSLAATNAQPGGGEPIFDPIAEENFNDSIERSLEIISDLRTPAEQLFDKFDEIQQLFAAGLIPEGIFERAADDLLAGLSEIQQNTPAAKMRKDMENQANRLFESTRTPAERFQEELDKIGKLKTDRLISNETFDRAVEMARNDFLASVEKSVPQALDGVGALQRGSSEAESAIQAAIRASRQDPVATNTKKIADTGIQQLRELSIIRERLAEEQQVIGL